MNDVNVKDKSKVKQLLSDDWEERSPIERRSDRDKRKTPNPEYFKNGGKERRMVKDRRRSGERRDGWMRTGRWRSESVFDE